MKPVDAPEGTVWEYEFGGHIYVVLREPFFANNHDGSKQDVRRRWCFALAGPWSGQLTTIAENSGWDVNSTRLD